jgi:pimeloyl-ACP methyl ester carboxylesterase
LSLRTAAHLVAAGCKAERWRAGRSAELCDDVELEVVAGATHWLHHEEAGSVNRRLLEFFG